MSFKFHLLTGFFLISSIAVPAQSGLFGSSCSDRDIMKTWFEIKSDANTGADLEPRLDGFRNYLSKCNYSYQPNGEINERNFAIVLQRGYVNEYNPIIKGITDGHSGDLERALFLAKKIGKFNKQVRSKLQSQVKQNKENCQNRDYRSKLPPIRDQDSVGWCYGFTAADLHSFKSGKHISALDTSIAFYDDTSVGYTHSLQRTIFLGVRTFSTSPGVDRKQGGLNVPALRQGIQNGVCLENDLPSEDSGLSGATGSLYRRLRKIEDISNSYRQTCKGPIGPGPAQGCSGRDTELSSGETATLRSVAPSLSDSELNAIVRNRSTNLLKQLRKRSCEDKINITGTVHSHNSDIKENISSQLSNGNIVAIAYNADVLMDKSEASGLSDHASSVVGQRWNSDTHQCEFLLRNSWGADCYYADSSYDCEPDGHIWIPSKTLEESTSEVSYIK